ncbi:hypothetical protein ACWEFL_24485 [Streptomyces sp. NPDC004838]
MNGHEHRRERYEPDGPFDDRTGNGIVNNGPENEWNGRVDGSDGPGTPGGPAGAGGTGGPSGPGFPGGSDRPDESDDGDGDGLAPDELELRRLFQGAVEDLRPADGALDHLRRAVPARKARKRQILIGAVAAVLLMGTGVPAFVHVANSDGGANDPASVSAGHGKHSEGGTDEEQGSSGGHGDSGGSKESGEEGEGPGKPSDSPGGPSGTGTGGNGTGGTAVPPGIVATDSPKCAAEQLGVTSAQAGQPDSEGKVYGTFRVANVSATECAVSGRGTIGFAVKGAADESKIKVVDHTAGDAATGLPDPSQEAAALLLKPDSVYEVRFAWVPKETCPTGGPSPDPTDSPGTSGSASASGGSAPNNVQPQLETTETGTDGSVSVTHTAEPGAPSAETTIPNACSGTIYRTGVLGG